MIRGLQLGALAFALVGIGFTLRAYRMAAAVPATRRFIAASLLVPLAIIVGVAPGLLFPSLTWLRIASSVVSFVMAAASLAISVKAIRMFRRQTAALRSGAFRQ